MNTSEIIFVGVKGHVVAIEKVGGRILWQTKLKGGFLSAGGAFVTVLVDGDRIYAHTSGELFCLDAISGHQIWNNELEGLGYDIASIAIQGASVPSQEMVARILQKRAEESSSNASSTSAS